MRPSRTTHTIPLSLSQLQYTSSLFYSSPPRVILAHRYHDLARRTRPRPTRPHHHHHHNAPNTKPIPTFLSGRHSFSTSTPARHEHEQNYYEILEIPITATTQEIKKKFYALSLLHHPDRNRTDPTASTRFSQISTAYSVLVDANKRATYDRDHGIHHRQAYTHTPAGSHSSHSANLHKGAAGYAGSRPASGLSKRRGTFRGPPPSFYEQGGYGDTGRSASASAAGSGGGFRGPAGGGSATADPDDPLGFIDRNPVGHFNARSHFRTQRAEDERRRERASRARRAAREKSDMIVEGGASFGIVRFVIVCGILVVAGTMMGLWKREDGGKGKRKKDASSS